MIQRPAKMAVLGAQKSEPAGRSRSGDRSGDSGDRRGDSGDRCPYQARVGGMSGPSVSAGCWGAPSAWNPGGGEDGV